MTCPRCKKELEQAIFHNTEIDYCPQCLGIFFEEGELEQAKDNHDRDLRWLDIDLWEDKNRFKIVRGIRSCPYCRLPLYEVYYDDSSVVVDVCNLCHGVWLDRAEFKKIIEYLKKKADYQALNEYLKTLAQVRATNHDLTPFLLFGLKGIALQCRRLFDEIKKNISKTLFRECMYDLFIRMQTAKKRVIAERQIEILKILLDGPQTLDNLIKKVTLVYKDLKNPGKAVIRDLNYLIGLHAIRYTKDEKNIYTLFVRLEWGTEITESEFFERIKKLPKAKGQSFLSFQ